MIDETALERLEAKAVAALDGDAPPDLEIIDYGEISTVLGADGPNGPLACKRLPVMSSTQLAEYTAVLNDYLAALRDRGVSPAPTEVHSVGTDPVVPYCVQPRYTRLLADDMRSGDTGLMARRSQRLVELVSRAADDGLGLDGQISNWAIEGDDLVYLDVTTPLIRDAAGKQRLDLDLFIASLPWAMRGTVRRFLLGEILSHYHATRPVLLDAVANLRKERLHDAIPILLDAANDVVDEPITPDEAGRYYRRDALMWEVLQRLRRADRWWQRRVRRRRYPFLLPGRVER